MPGLYLTDPAISASGSPVRPTAGQRVTVTLQVANSGGTAGQFSLSGVLVLSGTQTVEAHLGQNGSPTSPATGSIPAVGEAAPAPAVVTLYSGAMATSDQFAGYNAATGFDLLLTLTDTATNAQTVYSVASAVFAPASPAALAVVGVSLGVA